MRVRRIVPLLLILCLGAAGHAAAVTPAGVAPPPELTSPGPVLLAVSQAAPASPAAPGDWVTVNSLDFESDFPAGGWTAVDYLADANERFWGRAAAVPHGGSYAAWPARGGAQGIDPLANTTYPANTNTRMTYGPFDLTGASHALVEFWTWNRTHTSDLFKIRVSADGTNYAEAPVPTNGAWTLYWWDLSGFVGDATVWLQFDFGSGAAQQDIGPWLDDIVIEKQTPAPYNCATGVPLLTAASGQDGPVTGAVAPIGTGAPFEVQLKSRVFVPQRGITAESAQAFKAIETGLRNAGGGRTHLLVQFESMPDALQVRRLEAQGLRLLDYIPDRAWLASATAGALAALPDLPALRWAEPFPSSDRLDPYLATGLAATLGNAGAQVRAHFFADVPAAELDAVAAAHRAVVLDALPERHHVDLLLSVADARAIALEERVQWLEYAPPEKITQNDCVRWRTKVDEVQAAPYGLSGAGVDLGIWDGGQVDPHPDFAGRLTVVNTDLPVGNHPTHVAGTMAGSGANSVAQGGTALGWRGVAPASDIFSYNWNSNLTEHNQAINTYGIELSQNSWGYVVSSVNFNCLLYGNYSTDAPDYDSIITGLYGKRISVVFAAGNERDDGDCGMTGVAPEYLNYSVIAPPSTAKNIITVGATNSNDDSMTGFSSWGPTDDGRVKPEVVAPGCELATGGDAIYSTLPGGAYGLMCGTSMAAPAVSGISALVIERYRSATTLDPLPSTVKALLAHTAVDLSDTTSYYNPGPDYASGYGRVDAQAAVDAIAAGLVREDSVTNGITDNFTFQVTPGAPAAKVTLVWDDPPGSVNASPALVNNLDLWLIAPDGTTIHRPWVLNPASPAADATRGIDSINIIEQVYLANPTAGMWRARVAGTSVTAGGQLYSLVGYPFVVEGGPLAYQSVVVDDDMTGGSIGDGDGLAECGETVALGVTLVNQGAASSLGIAAGISGTGTGLNWSGNTSSAYPDAAGGATPASSDPYELSIAAGAPPSQSIPISLAITASNGGPWTGGFNLPVTCSAPPAPASTSVGVSGGNIQLGWAAAFQADHYEVWWDTGNPHFSPGSTCAGSPNCASVTSPAYLANGAGGDASTNYTWVVLGVNGGGRSAPSAPVGEFDFALSAGITP